VGYGPRMNALVVCVIGLLWTTLAQTSPCISFPTATAPCSSVVTWQIPGNWSVIMENTQAGLEAEPSRSGFVCPFYLSVSYQCRKHFPQCTFNAATNTTTILKVCRTSCMSAQTADSNLCGSRYSDASFQAECSNDHYGDPPCLTYTFDNGDSSSGTWKIVLVSILGVVGVGILASFAWNRWRAYKTSQELAREDDDDARAQRLRQEHIEDREAVFGVVPTVSHVDTNKGGATMAELPPVGISTSGATSAAATGVVPRTSTTDKTPTRSSTRSVTVRPASGPRLGDWKVSVTIALPPPS